MAMLRLPTQESNGRANLHQGGIGTGVDLDTGVTNHAVQRNRFVARHPDTGSALVGLRVPYWREELEMSRKVARAAGLGYLGGGLGEGGDGRAGGECWKRRPPGPAGPPRPPTPAACGPASKRSTPCCASSRASSRRHRRTSRPTRRRRSACEALDKVPPKSHPDSDDI